MKGMTNGEKEQHINIVNKTDFKHYMRKRIYSPETSARRRLKMRIDFNRRKNVTKRSWKLLKELWDVIRINTKKIQTTDLDVKTASGEETFDGELAQSFEEMEISTPPPFNENIQCCGSVKFERCHTPSMSNTELEPFPEPQEEFCPREGITHFSPPAQALTAKREKELSTSQCSCCTAMNLDPHLSARIMALKNYNDYRNQMEASTLEKAELERRSAEANLQHIELQVDAQQIFKENAELQNQILRLKKEQVEQKIAQQEEMHLMKLKIKKLLMLMAESENSLQNDSNYPPVAVE